MIKITLKRSVIGFEKSQGRTARALGLGRVGSSVIQAESPAILGMVRKITHLLDVQKLKEPVEGEQK